MTKVRLDEICVVIAGQSPPSDSYNQDKNGVPFFQGKADFGSLYPTVRYWCNKPAKMSLPNDILFSVRAPVGPTNINNIEACIGRGLSALRCKEGVLEMKYLLHYLRANENKISDLGTGSTFKAITISELKKLQIPLPPLPQQQKIANILDATDALRQNDKALIAKYDELTQSLFLDMFGDPQTNSKGLLELELGEVLDLITYGLTVRPDYIENGIPLISAREIRTGKIELQKAPKISQDDFNKLSNKGIPRINDILFSKTGSIGHCALVKSADVFAITQNVARLTFKKNIIPVYAMYYLKSSYIQQLSQQRAKGNAVKDLQLGDMKKFKFICPDTILQIQFAERVAVMEEQKAIAQKSLEKSDELFNSLLQKAFKGELA